MELWSPSKLGRLVHWRLDNLADTRVENDVGGVVSVKSHAEVARRVTSNLFVENSEALISDRHDLMRSVVVD